MILLHQLSKSLFTTIFAVEEKTKLEKQSWNMKKKEFFTMHKHKKSDFSFSSQLTLQSVESCYTIRIQYWRTVFPVSRYGAVSKLYSVEKKEFFLAAFPTVSFLVSNQRFADISEKQERAISDLHNHHQRTWVVFIGKGRDYSMKVRVRCLLLIVEEKIRDNLLNPFKHLIRYQNFPYASNIKKRMRASYAEYKNLYWCSWCVMFLRRKVGQK